MVRFGKIAVLSLVALLGAVPVLAQAPPHITAAQEFLLAWGKSNWDAVKGQTVAKVTVKVGGTDYSLEAEAKKAGAQLVLPFRGLSSVREKGKVTGVTVEEMTVKAGGAEKKGKGTLTIEEKDGKFTVTGVTVE
ncbi:MAG: hypothetical protein ACHQ7N_10060 [Candidatus Methylomirabilales bacterium]